MITYIFGKPGTGKTTYLAYLAIRENRRINKGKSRYQRVLVNTHSLVIPLRPGEKNFCYIFDPVDFGFYDFSNSLILWDEASFNFDKIDFKKVKPEVRRELMLHRHRHIDIVFFNQLYSGLNNKIREICNATYQLKKTLTGKIVPHRIDFDIHIPKKPSLSDRDKIENNGGEVKEYYYRVGFVRDFLYRIFCRHSIKASKYWNYFNSYECDPLPTKRMKECSSIDI